MSSATVPPDRHDARRRDGVELRLLGGLDLNIEGGIRSLGASCARVLAFVALGPPHGTDRHRMAGMLWPECTDARALANLRSTLWRLRQTTDEVVSAEARTVRLSPRVRLDVQDLDACVDQSIERGRVPDLLPGWYDDWVIYQRERFRQALLLAIEARAQQLIDTGDFASAIDVGLIGIGADPLRESCHRLAARAHLGQGNYPDAVRVYEAYCALLHAELGVSPSPGFFALLETEVSRRSPSGQALRSPHEGDSRVTVGS